MSLLTALWLVQAGCTRSEIEQSDPKKGSEPGEQGNVEVGAQSGDNAAGACAPGTRQGKAGSTDGETTAKGIAYNVRTPETYDPTAAYPLLMVYAPAGMSRFRTERFTGLTADATAAGFVVAYADRRRLSIEVIAELGTIPSLIAAQWCINPKRVYLTGHSDGGTVALALLEKTTAIPAALAPSAAGIRGTDLAAFACPAPRPVMVMHSANDTHFPGFGTEAAAWWAACNRCDPTPSDPMLNGCRAYPNCAGGAATWYCEGTGSHAAWPALNDSLIKFFSAVGDAHARPG